MADAGGILTSIHDKQGETVASRKSARAVSRLSVIIPSFQSRYLSKVLSSIKCLNPQQIIVVDSSPEKPVINDPAITLVYSATRLSPGAARNLGTKRASGDYLLFVDSDVLLSE